MKKKQIAITATALVLLSIGTGVAFAQGEADPEPGVNYVGILTALGTFVVAGVFYATSGWIKKIRRKLAGDSAPLDWVKLGKTTAIGVILGIGAMIFSVYNGEVIQITDMHEFFVQVGVNSAAILFIDKWILGRADNTPVSTTSTTSTTTS